MSVIEIIGGIKFYSKDINEVNLKDELFDVIMADGTELKYGYQPREREAEVIVKSTGRVEFNGLINVTIKDSPNNDVYLLAGCESVTLEADRGLMRMKDEMVGIDQDLIQLKNRLLKNGEVQYSKSNTLKLNKCDLYQLPNETSINFVNEDSEQVKE